MFERDPSGLAPRTILENAVCDPPYTQFWVWDPPGGNDIRRSIFPEYKMQRKPTPTGVSNNLDFVRQILKHAPIYEIETPGYEADDVIATIAKKASENSLVAIYANDFDYMALTAKDNIICGANPKEHVKPEEVRVYKWACGDSSDNIKGIRNFGKKAWLNCCHESLERLAQTIYFSDKELTKEDILNICPDLQQKQAEWIRDNQTLMSQYWEVLGFIDVPTELISKHTQIHTSNFSKADQILKRWLL